MLSISECCLHSFVLIVTFGVVVILRHYFHVECEPLNLSIYVCWTLAYSMRISSQAFFSILFTRCIAAEDNHYQIFS